MLKVEQRVLVVVRLEFAEAEEGVRRTHLGVQPDHIFEGRHGFRVVVRVIVERAQVPPALRPPRLESQTLLVERDRFLSPAGLARSSGALCQVVEGVCRGRFRLGERRLSDQRHQQQDEKNCGFWILDFGLMTCRLQDCAKWNSRSATFAVILSAAKNLCISLIVNSARGSRFDCRIPSFQFPTSNFYFRLSTFQCAPNQGAPTADWRESFQAPHALAGTRTWPSLERQALFGRACGRPVKARNEAAGLKARSGKRS